MIVPKYSVFIAYDYSFRAMLRKVILCGVGSEETPVQYLPLIYSQNVNCVIIMYKQHGIFAFTYSNPELFCNNSS